MTRTVKQWGGNNSPAPSQCTITTSATTSSSSMTMTTATSIRPLTAVTTSWRDIHATIRSQEGIQDEPPWVILLHTQCIRADAAGVIFEYNQHLCGGDWPLVCENGAQGKGGTVGMIRSFSDRVYRRGGGGLSESVLHLLQRSSRQGNAPWSCERHLPRSTIRTTLSSSSSSRIEWVAHDMHGTTTTSASRSKPSKAILLNAFPIVFLFLHVPFLHVLLLVVLVVVVFVIEKDVAREGEVQIFWAATA